MEPTSLLCDNQSSIKLAHTRTKHIEIHYHFVREKVLSKEVDLSHVSTGEPVADILTKPLGRTKFEKFRSELGLRDLKNLNYIIVFWVYFKI